MNFGFPKFIFNRIVLRQCLREADAIACVSETTRIRLKQYAPAAIWQKAIRIYNCVEPEPVSATQSPIPGWRSEPFLLCVAQHRRNKNIPTLIRAFHRLLRSGEIEPDSKLVVVGMAGPESGKIRRLVAASGLHGSVHFLEALTEPQLQWCYRHCQALVEPSLTEGFGLPVAEGLLAGCRIVCSDIPAHREIADGHCQFRLVARIRCGGARSRDCGHSPRAGEGADFASATLCPGARRTVHGPLSQARCVSCARRRRACRRLHQHCNLREPVCMKAPQNHSAPLREGK